MTSVSNYWRSMWTYKTDPEQGIPTTNGELTKEGEAAVEQQQPALTKWGGEEGEKLDWKKEVKEDMVACIAWAKNLYKTTTKDDYKRMARASIRRKYWGWWITLGIMLVFAVLVPIYHHETIMFFRPIGKKMRSWPGGWLIWVVVLVIISFPPLAGHEIVGIVLGIIYGLNVGFWILTLGTFLGELLEWYAFKWLFVKKARKLEKKNKMYGCLVELIRTESFMFVIILRFSAIPGHLVTAVSASSGMHILPYAVAAALSLPKQLTLAYVGTAFDHPGHNQKIISIVTLIATIVGTGIAALYIYWKMRCLIRRKNRMLQMQLPTTDINQTEANECTQVGDYPLTTTEFHFRHPFDQPGTPLAFNATEKDEFFAPLRSKSVSHHAGRDSFEDDDEKAPSIDLDPRRNASLDWGFRSPYQQPLPSPSLGPVPSFETTDAIGLPTPTKDFAIHEYPFPKRPYRPRTGTQSSTLSTAPLLPMLSRNESPPSGDSTPKE